MQQDAPQTMQWTVPELTGGRPYVFVIMAYQSEIVRTDYQPIYAAIDRVVENRFKMKCIRADAVPGSGYDLRSKLHSLIDRAELVIAEVSEDRPNVFYEVGYAVAKGKQVLLVQRKGRADFPNDLKGLETIEWEQTWDGAHKFEEQLTNDLRIKLGSELPLLSDMLVAPNPLPAYIVASPKYPGERSRIAGQVYDARTFGDHLGIRGLISAFGALTGEGHSVELISAQHAPPDLLCRPHNLYLIGSPKVNAHAGLMLALLTKHREPRWVFAPPAWYWEKLGVGETKDGWFAPPPEHVHYRDDWPVGLFEIGHVGNAEQLRGKCVGDVWEEDWGIIVRGPHPDHADRVAMVMAGAHSLGTGAACLAATMSPLIRSIREKLGPGKLEDKSCTFWARVKGRVNSEDRLLDPEGVTIDDAGVYD